MNYFNPTISNVFTYPDMAGQLERLNDKQSAGLRNAINYAVDAYKFKKLNDEQKKKEAEKKAEAERREAMAESRANYYGGLDRGPSTVAVHPYQTGGQAAYEAYEAALAAAQAKRGL